MLKYSVSGQYGSGDNGEPGLCKTAKTAGACHALEGCTTRRTAHGTTCVARPYYRRKKTTLYGFTAPSQSAVHLYSDSKGHYYHVPVEDDNDVTLYTLGTDQVFCGQDVHIVAHNESITTGPTVAEATSEIVLKDTKSIKLAVVTDDIVYIRTFQIIPQTCDIKTYYSVIVKQVIDTTSGLNLTRIPDNKNLYRIDFRSLATAGQQQPNVAVTVKQFTVGNADKDIQCIIAIATSDKKLVIPVKIPEIITEWADGDYKFDELLPNKHVIGKVNGNEMCPYAVVEKLPFRPWRP